MEANKEENINESDNIHLIKARKANLEKMSDLFQFRWWIVLLFSFGGAAITYTEKASKPFQDLTIIEIVPIVILGAILGIVVYGVSIGYVKLLFGIMSSKYDIQLAKQGAEELQEKIEENFFTKLVKINFKYIDQYYLQTQEQANKSFRLTMFACIAGLAVVVVGIAMMFQGKTEPAYVTTAVGLLSEFIAAVFFYLYNKTIVKMGEYHQKLVITQNISLALKIAESLPDSERVMSQQALIEKLTENVNQYLSLSYPQDNKAPQPTRKPRG